MGWIGEETFVVGGDVGLSPAQRAVFDAQLQSCILWLIINNMVAVDENDEQKFKKKVIASLLTMEEVT
jgi:hypothetical protein